MKIREIAASSLFPEGPVAQADNYCGGCIERVSLATGSFRAGR